MGSLVGEVSTVGLCQDLIEIDRNRMKEVLARVGGGRCLEVGMGVLWLGVAFWWVGVGF